MERAISSLAFKGSITEAVVEAKRQKKLFVVYISGHNPESIHVEESLWTDQHVTESISKYCILLHILEGSTDATQFSAIYPQKSVPCIAAIGYNGVQLWQSEGFVSAEVLASSLEKAWLSLHIQETTATFLTAAAALASSAKAEEPPAPEASSSDAAASFEHSGHAVEVNPRPADVAPDLPEHAVEVIPKPADMAPDHPEHAVDVNPKPADVASDHSEHAVDINPKPADVASPSSVLVNDLESAIPVVPSIVTVKEPLNNPLKKEEDLNNNGVGNKSSPSSSGRERYRGVNNNNNVEASRVILVNEANSKAVVVADKKAGTTVEEVSDILEESCSRSNTKNEVHLNIRLPNGGSLQKKFSVMSTLRKVKDYVDENQEIGVGSYDLAIPYPRKVFDNQDLSKTLSELDLFNRQALIVVPHHPTSSSSSRNQSISNDKGVADSENMSGEGYFAYVKRIISYVNPFTYLGGGASSASGPAKESPTSMWQYSPNPTMRNNLMSGGGASSSSDSNSSSGTRRRKAEPGRFGSGSNIHTLKRDEDEDSRFNGKNAFWNGNSTQYGGDNNDSK